MQGGYYVANRNLRKGVSSWNDYVRAMFHSSKMNNAKFNLKDIAKLWHDEKKNKIPIYGNYPHDDSLISIHSYITLLVDSYNTEINRLGQVLREYDNIIYTLREKIENLKQRKRQTQNVLKMINDAENKLKEMKKKRDIQKHKISARRGELKKYIHENYGERIIGVKGIHWDY